MFTRKYEMIVFVILQDNNKVDLLIKFFHFLNLILQLIWMKITYLIYCFFRYMMYDMEIIDGDNYQFVSLYQMKMQVVNETNILDDEPSNLP